MLSSLEHMKDILVIYEQEAEEWAVYLKSLFGLVLNEEGVLLYNLETLSFKHLESFSLPCYKCKLLILSCGLLKCLNRERCCFLEYVLQPPDNVVILLCGVENSEILYKVLTLGGRSRGSTLIRNLRSISQLLLESFNQVILKCKHCVIIKSSLSASIPFEREKSEHLNFL